MTLVSIIHSPDIFLVQVSASVDPKALSEWVKDDTDVKHIELNKKFKQSRSKGPGATLSASAPTSTYLTDKKLVSIYGNSAIVAYVQQPAFYSGTAYSAGVQAGLTGVGTIAVIDTGVDEQNPILAPVVVPGYDFTRNLPGFASDLADLDQSTAHILHQSTAHILHQSTAHILHQLNNSSAAVLDANTANALASTVLPNDFGHGTMVAGLIHLVAPGAKIMSLKAFSADGSGDEANIVRAIYFAADSKVNIINMSFGFPGISDALMKAINYANRKGVICVASVGNDAQTALVYPAAFGNVIGVASVDSQNQPSIFTNRGADLVTIAAPGEDLVTTFPGDQYAVASGTSFSAPLVAGAASLMLEAAKGNIAMQLQEADIARALRHASACVNDGSLGAGCMDLNQAVSFVKSMNMAGTPVTK
ncbi:MAG TPA: S8 family serine peptidase [Candidatus Saccharimonadales bacterium]|nr:S8 family serine peptidase [Candidatus Saccharimonadales bacterium]